MKRFLQLTFICFALTLFSGVNAQSTEMKSMELIMEVPKADALQSFKAIKKKLNTLPDVKVEGFCNTRKLLLLRIHPKEYFNVMVAVNEAGFAYYIKNDLHISEVISGCEQGDLYTAENAGLE